MKLSIEDFFSKYDQIRSFFCAVDFISRNGKNTVKSPWKLFKS